MKNALFDKSNRNAILMMTGSARKFSEMNQALLDDMHNTLRPNEYVGNHNGFYGKETELGGAKVLFLMPDHALVRGIERKDMKAEEILNDVVSALQSIIDASFEVEDDATANQLDTLVWDSGFSGSIQGPNGRWYPARNANGYDGISIEVIHTVCGEQTGFIACLEHTQRVWVITTILTRTQRTMYPDNGFACVKDNELVSWTRKNRNGETQFVGNTHKVASVRWLSVQQALRSCAKWHPCLVD